MSSNALTPDLAAALRGRVSANARVVDLRGDFPQQQAYVTDPSRRTWALCTRRAAKSYSGGLKMVRSMLSHGGKHLCLGLTRASVEGAFWRDVFKAIDDRYHLDLDFNETRLEARAANGGSIRLLGMDSNDGERRKVLGAKHRGVLIDEAQDFHTDLEHLVEYTLGPSLADQGGWLSLGGTPGNLTTGFFHRLTTGNVAGWSGHSWDTHKNTAVPRGETRRMCDLWADEIAEKRKNNPLIDQVPAFRQNYLGEWFIDDTVKVYRYLAGRNDYDTLPALLGSWHFVLACDLGYMDATAFTVCAYHDHDRRLFIPLSEKKTGMDITDVANRAKALAAIYDFDAYVIDGANKQAVEEMRKRHDVPWRAADKRGKADFIELLNAEMIQARVLLGRNTEPLKDEHEKLIWDKRKMEAGVREEDERCANHCADSLLYGWRFCFQYLSQVPEAPVLPGSTQWMDAEVVKMREMEESVIMEMRRNREEEESWQ